MCNKKQARLKDGGQFLTYKIVQKPAKVMLDGLFCFYKNVKIKVSNAITKVAKANINMSAW